MFCNYCGSPNPDDADYCSKCGRKTIRLDETQQDKVTTTSPTPGAKAQLLAKAKKTEPEKAAEESSRARADRESWQKKSLLQKEKPPARGPAKHPRVIPRAYWIVLALGVLILALSTFLSEPIDPLASLLIKLVSHSLILGAIAGFAWFLSKRRPGLFIRVFAILFLANSLLAAFGSAERAERQAPRLYQVHREKLSAPILSLDLAADSELAAIALSGGWVRIWRLDTNETVREFKPLPEPVRDDEILRVRFSPDGRTLAVSCFNRVYLYDVHTWEEKGSLGLDAEDVTQVLLLKERSLPPPDTEFKAVDEKRMVTRIADFAFTADGRHILTSYCRLDCRLHLLFDADVFAKTTDDDAVRLWEVESGRLVWERKCPGPPVRVVPSPDNKLFGLVIPWGKHQVHLHNLENGKRFVSLPPFDYHGIKTVPVFFLPGGNQFITASTAPSSRNDRRFEHLALYDSRTGRMLREFRSKHGSGDGDLSPDGRWLVAHNWTKRGFKLWDVETGRPSKTYFPKIGLLTQWGHIPTLLRFDPEGRWLVLVDCGEGYLAVYEIRR
jgi:WD40 repeat protein